MTHVRKHGRTVGGRTRTVKAHERDTGPARLRPLPAPVIQSQDHNDSQGDADEYGVMVIDTDQPPGQYTDTGRELVDNAYRAMGWNPDEIRTLPVGDPLRDQYDRKVAENNPSFYIDPALIQED